MASALLIAQNAAVAAGKSVLLFNAELNPRDFVTRQVAADGHRDHKRTYASKDRAVTLREARNFKRKTAGVWY